MGRFNRLIYLKKINSFLPARGRKWGVQTRPWGVYREAKASAARRHSRE